jgi:preprotein translocase subunit Sec61beta
MAQDNKINLPGGFGGLMRYSDEYSSYVNLKPSHIVLFVLLIVAFRIVMPFIFK